MTQEKFKEKMIIIPKPVEHTVCAQTKADKYNGKRFRRKPMRCSVATNHVQHKHREIEHENKQNTDLNNNEKDSFYEPDYKSRFSTEVIDIEEERVKAKADISKPKERFGVKRKKASLDQLLSKVVAKKNKLNEKTADSKTEIREEKEPIYPKLKTQVLEPEPRKVIYIDSETRAFERKETIYHEYEFRSPNPKETVYCSHQLYARPGHFSSESAFTPVPRDRHLTSSRHHRQYTPSVVSKRHHSYHHHSVSTIASPDSSSSSSSSTSSRKDQHSEKQNKRTISTNQRYSKLSNTQLQRRLVANARERSRVHALSNAFDALRCTIPSYSTEQKLSKLTILRVAINYIDALTQLLAPTTPDTEERFERCVEECTSVLQTEYGRSKTK